MEILKEDLYSYLAEAGIFPGSDRYDLAIKETLFDFVGISEGNARNDLVVFFVSESQKLAAKCAKSWRSCNRIRKDFEAKFAKTGGFLWNFISIPGPHLKENEFIPYSARKKRRRCPRGAPSPLHGDYFSFVLTVNHL